MFGNLSWIWESLMDAGEPEGIMPFGVKAQRVWRLEKAYNHSGARYGCDE